MIAHMIYGLPVISGLRSESSTMDTNRSLSALHSFLLLKLRGGPASTTALLDDAGFKDGIAETALSQLAKEGLIEGDDNMWTITDQGITRTDVIATAILDAVMKAEPPN